MSDDPVGEYSARSVAHMEEVMQAAMEVLWDTNDPEIQMRLLQATCHECLEGHHDTCRLNMGWETPISETKCRCHMSGHLFDVSFQVGEEP